MEIKPHNKNLALKVKEFFPFMLNTSINDFLKMLSLSSKELIQKADVTLQKPYGLNHILFYEKSYGISLAQINITHGTSYHFHTQRSELFCVKAGQLTLIKEDKKSVLEQYKLGFSRPFEKHSLRNSGTSILEILEIFAPPLLNDKTRVIDTYFRKLGTVTYLE